MKHGIGNLLEIICVAALLLLFGLTTFTLVSVGADAYSRLLDKRDAASNMRSASSYLSMRVRQSDSYNAVEVRRESVGDVLVLLKDDDEGLPYETRIYRFNGSLYESVADVGDAFSPELGFEIVPIGLFLADWRDGKLTFTLESADMFRVFSLYPRGGMIA